MNANSANADLQAQSPAATVAAHGLFKGLAPQYIQLLAEAAMFKQFETNELIFKAGDPANRFYLLLSGEVALERADKDRPTVVIQTIGPDNVLGWSWLFPPYYWNFDARATRPTKAVFFYGTWLRENCERDAAFGYEMMKRMAVIMIQRLQTARRRLVELMRT
jgi:CRP-like cAMP-binding protein